VEVPCSQALAPSLLAGYDWALNPYRGCALDCLYCYAPDVVGIDRASWASTVFVKRSIPTLLAREVRKKPRGIVGVSTVTDAYQPAEKRLEVTRRCLEVLARAQWPVSVLTKSALVTRDLDLLTTIPSAEVGFSIATGADLERRRWEPSCPPIGARIEALRRVAQAGVRAYVFAGPLFPESQEASVRLLARLAAEAGASKLIADALHRRPGGLERVLEATSPTPRRHWAERTEALLVALEDECRQAALPFARAQNWKPRPSGGDRRDDHLVAARAAVEEASVLKQPREVARLAAPFAQALPVDASLQEFD
jgi:DNA repair photolyase